MKALRNVLAGFLVAGGLVLLAGPLFAHHSQASYDTSRDVTLTGTVTEFEFVNPHVRVHFQVKKDNGDVEQWVGESAQPNNFRRRGWTRSTLKPGDQIIVTVHAAKDGSKEGHIQSLSLGGKEIYRSPTAD